MIDKKTEEEEFNHLSNSESGSGNQHGHTTDDILGGDGDLPDPESIKFPGREHKGDMRTISDLDKPKEKDKSKEAEGKRGWDFRGNK